MQVAAVRSMETNPAKMTQLYAEQFRLSAVKAGETIAIVSDLGTRREYIQAAFAAAESLGADIYEMCVNSIPSWTTRRRADHRPVQGHARGGVEGRHDRDLPRAAVQPLAEDGDGRRHPRADDHRRARPAARS